MPDIERESFSSFMNITDTAEFDAEAAQAFLSSDTEITPIPKKEEVKVEKKVEKKEEKQEEFDAETALLGKEEEEEEEIEKEEEKEEESINQFEALSKELYSLGIFTADEEPELAKTPEEFKTLFEKQGERKASTWIENFLSNFGEDYRAMFDAVFINGVNPQEYLSVYAELDNLSDIDLTDENNQETIVREYYGRAGWKKERIEAKIQHLKDSVFLEQEAKDVHERIIEQDEKKLADLEESNKRKLAAQLQQDQEYKTNISKIIQDKLKTKEFDGLPIDDKRAQEAFNFLYTKKYKTPDGQELTEFDKFIFESRKPDNLGIRLKIALLALENFDFSKIKKKAVSEESNTLFKDFTLQKTKTAKKSPTNNWLKI